MKYKAETAKLEKKQKLAIIMEQIKSSYNENDDHITDSDSDYDYTKYIEKDEQELNNNIVATILTYKIGNDSEVHNINI
jgi:hypothetical protein